MKPLSVEKADDWTPANARWVCFGPNLFKPSGPEHIVIDPHNRSQHVVKDEFGCRSVLCRPCAVKLGVEW
jgi:hypothetical protein